MRLRRGYHYYQLDACGFEARIWRTRLRIQVLRVRQLDYIRYTVWVFDTANLAGTAGFGKNDKKK